MTTTAADHAPEISKVMVLSTGHLPMHIVNRPEEHTYCSVLKRDEGFVVATYLAEYDNPYVMFEAPALLKCMQFARKYGCAYVMFDRDGPMQPELPRFDW